MKTNKFSALQLNKKSIAKLNDAQLSKLKGGNNSLSSDGDCRDKGITCSTAGATIIVQSVVS